MLGLVVGVVSSMLGVAGGELLIPSLVFIFGADIKIAGTLQPAHFTCRRFNGIVALP